MTTEPLYISDPDEDGCIDEIIASGADVHIERMSEHHWWGRITGSDGSTIELDIVKLGTDHDGDADTTEFRVDTSRREAQLEHLLTDPETYWAEARERARAQAERELQQRRDRVKQERRMQRKARRRRLWGRT